MIIENRFTGAIILKTQEANLQEANLQGANLQEANLRGADLQEANLREANLRGANLRGANLWEANLQGANLQEANLQGANLQEANLQEADLRGADLRGANLWGANLRGAKYGGLEIRKYFTITRIGSRLDTLEVYILSDGAVICKTGCFTGSPQELKSRLNFAHPEHREYEIALIQIEAMRRFYCEM